MIHEMRRRDARVGLDHPHTDGVWPESSKYIEEQFGHLPARRRRKITFAERREVLRFDELRSTGGPELASTLRVPGCASWPSSGVAMIIW